jgi:hypothetical protein
MFSLTEQTAKLNNVNPRAELHGDEHKLAVDLSLEIKVGNDILDAFHPDLKPSIYRAATEADRNDNNDLFSDAPGYLPKIKFPLLAPFKWGYENDGYEATVHFGVSGKANILMLACKVDKFRFDCQDGGTVKAAFRVVAHPTAEETGRLCEMSQQEITISLVPPSADDLLRSQLLNGISGDDGE